jgi:hypothetical protein
MVYLLQAEEQEISLELLQQLAKVLVRLPEVAFADATHQVHMAHGIYELPDEAEAARVAKGFAAEGFPTITVPEIFPPPAPELLNRQHLPEGKIELAAAGQVHLVKSVTETEFKAPRISLFSPILVVPGSGSKEITRERSEFLFYLEVFAGARHWRMQSGGESLLLEYLAKMDLSGALLGAGVKHLLEKNRRLPAFDKEKEYDRYVSWLYQLLRAQKQDDLAVES